MGVLTTVSGSVLVAEESGGTGGRMCPVSGTRGLAVAVDPTVGNHVNVSTWDVLVGIDSLWFCSEADCPVVYFDDQHEHIWTTADLRTPVGVKMRLDPLPVCYCRRVSAGQIAFEIVAQHCCTSVKDIKEFTGANTGERCLITNPSGRCCGGHLKRVVEELLASSRVGAVPADVAAEAQECASCVPAGEE